MHYYIKLIEKKSHLTREIHDYSNVFQDLLYHHVNIKLNLMTSMMETIIIILIKLPEFLVYGRETCPYTVKANEYLESHKRSYLFHDMEEDPTKRRELEEHIAKSKLSDDEKKKLGFEGDEYPYVPAIIHKNKFIGGFGELQNIVK